MSFVWTQSALKDLEKPETCPARWKGQWIDKLFKSQVSEAADYGNYFEYLCIGANAKGEAVKDLPRLSTGAKSATQKRIELQAEVFKDLFDPKSPNFLGYEITGVQTHFKGSINGVDTEGTADIVGVNTAHKNPVIIDLKLTEDLDNTRTQYGWGNPIEELDLIQQVLYQELYFQQYGVRPEMVLMVFEHGTKGRVKIIKLGITLPKKEYMEERFSAGKYVIEKYEEKGWTYDPSKWECEKCPLTCEKRFNTNKIIIIETIY